VTPEQAAPVAVAALAGTDRVTAGERDLLLVPRTRGAGRDLPPVVFCHGAGGSALSWADPAAPGTTAAARGLVARTGLAGIAADLGGDTWGNATGIARIDAARTCAARLLGCRPDRMVLVGGSMGGLLAYAYAQARSDQVAGIVAVGPVTDLPELRARDPLGLAASVDLAWGVSPGVPLPAAADVTRDPAGLHGVPLAVYYSSGDTVVPASTVLPFAASAAADPVVDLGPVDHGDAQWAALPLSDVARWIAAASAGPPAAAAGH